MPVVTSARQRDRHLGSQYDTRRQRVGEVGELFSDHVARFQVGGEEHVRLSGYNRVDASVLGGLERYSVIDCQGAIEDGASENSIEKSGAPNSFWTAIGKTTADFPNLNWSNFLIGNLLPVTIGNIIGGSIMVAAVYWFVYLRKKLP